MSGSLNKVMLIGNLGDDVKIHHFEGGGSIGRFPLATNESYTKKDTGEKVTETEWHNIVVRNKVAEICLGGLGKVEILPPSDNGENNWCVNVRANHAVLACLGSQYAGWSLNHKDFFSLGSGPARAIAQREEIFREINYSDAHTKTVLVLEVEKEPPVEIIEKISSIIKDLPKTFQTPTMAPFCKDEEKYGVVNEIVEKIKNIKDDNIKVDELQIKNILTVNGVRFSLSDGSWGLIRASSNKPSLVVVIESPTSEERTRNIFNFIDGLLQKTGKIGKYDQKI